MRINFELMRNWVVYLFVFLSACTDDYIVPSHVPSVVKIVGNYSFVTYGDGGLYISDITTEEVVSHLLPTGGMLGIDDFDVQGDLLFVIDARGRNYLASYSIRDISNPVLVDGQHGKPTHSRDTQ